MTPLEMIAEWRRGCSNTQHTEPPLPPWNCQECTEALINAMERALKREERSARYWRLLYIAAAVYFGIAAYGHMFGAAA